LHISRHLSRGESHIQSLSTQHNAHAHHRLSSPWDLIGLSLYAESSSSHSNYIHQKSGSTAFQHTPSAVATASNSMPCLLHTLNNVQIPAESPHDTLISSYDAAASSLGWLLQNASHPQKRRLSRYHFSFGETPSEHMVA
jgi:hypothetical protein